MKPLLTLKASAGSGKTFALTVRYIALLVQGADPRRIVALTFTNKAALEMKERIQNVLFGLDNYHDYRYAIAQEVGLSDQELLKKKELLIQKFSESRPKILTIDSFFVAILRQFAWFVQLNPRFDVVNYSQESLIRPFLKRLIPQEHQTLLYFQQLYGGSPERLFEFLEQLYAQGQLFHRNILSTVSPKYDVLEVAYSLRQKILLSPLCGIQATKALDFDSFETLIEKGKTWLTRDSLSETNYFKKLATQEMEENFLILKEAIIEAFAYKERILLEHLSLLCEHYASSRQSVYRQKNELDFVDISDSLSSLLYHESIPNDFLYFRLDGRVEHLLIDEFQDTSITQYRFLEPIIDEICAGYGQNENRTLFVVGDPKQSIYRFRGANADVFDWISRKCEVAELQTNYRSASGIVAFVNQTFSCYESSGYYSSQLAHKSDEGFVRVIANRTNVIDDAIMQLKELLQQGVIPCDIAMLAQTNSDLNLLQEEILKECLDLNVVSETSLLLIEHPEVKAVIFGLKGIAYSKIPSLRVHVSYCFAHFFTYAHYPLNNEFLSDTYSLYSSPSKIIYQLMQEYHFSSLAMQRFLSLSLRFSSLLSFLEKIDTLSEVVPSESHEGVRLMTVHKSKGLEFPYVILLDRLSTKSPPPSPLLWTYKGLQLSKVSLRLRGRDKIDPLFYESCQEEEKLSSLDNRNRCYVALTRAKQGLIIIAKEQYSLFEPSFSYDYHYGCVVPSKEKKEKENSISLSFPLLERLGGQSHYVKKEPLTRFQHYGLALHEGMSRFPFLSNNHREMTLIRLENMWKQKLGDLFPQLIEHIDKLINFEPFLSLIRDKKVISEQAFFFEGKEGRIDLLAEDNDECIIIDYKSFNINEQDSYEQVKHYMKVTHHFSQKRVRGFLIAGFPIVSLHEVLL